ncbi:MULTISPECIES: hypothetical protein [Pseudomonas]|uniref:hypothetical protein n=1 Tax=Pseudomonas TaxID=286 RepID=UPI001E4B0F97|nr:MULTISPECIES: hypothetical protein [Pseudomonas]MCD5982577.1 hypothetical protein [Pseudomonas sp. CDFA 610]MCQ9473186.1 hypothetical protein [Pseudomonas alliivorans]
MNTQNHPNVIAKQNNAEEIKEMIRAFLVNELAEWSVDPEKLYINAINNQEERLVIFSKSISQEAWDCVYENDAGFVLSPSVGLFSEAYSFADEHRVAEPDLETVYRLIEQLVADLG